MESVAIVLSVWTGLAVATWWILRRVRHVVCACCGRTFAPGENHFASHTKTCQVQIREAYERTLMENNSLKIASINRDKELARVQKQLGNAEDHLAVVKTKLTNEHTRCEELKERRNRRRKKANEPVEWLRRHPLSREERQAIRQLNEGNGHGSANESGENESSVSESGVR